MGVVHSQPGFRSKVWQIILSESYRLFSVLMLKSKLKICVQ